MSHQIKKQLFVKYHHLDYYPEDEWKEERQFSNKKDFFNFVYYTYIQNASNKRRFPLKGFIEPDNFIFYTKEYIEIDNKIFVNEEKVRCEKPEYFDKVIKEALEYIEEMKRKFIARENIRNEKVKQIKKNLKIEEEKKLLKELQEKYGIS